jgi:hypothetical protein
MSAGFDSCYRREGKRAACADLSISHHFVLFLGLSGVRHDRAREAPVTKSVIVLSQLEIYGPSHSDLRGTREEGSSVIRRQLEKGVWTRLRLVEMYCCPRRLEFWQLIGWTICCVAKS